VNGGVESKVVDSVHTRKWTVGHSAIYYATAPDERGHGEIRSYEFATGKTTKILKMTRSPGWGMTLSPDDQTLLYTQIDEAGSDLMIVENFR
jgi:hypothetical protein